jgi:hypothetical protein
MDSLTVLAQKIAMAQQQQLLSGLMKGSMVYLILPFCVAMIAGLVLQFVFGRKIVGSRVGYQEFNESISRAHREREKGDSEIRKQLDTHSQENSKQFQKLSEGISWIKGFLEKNGKGYAT